MISKSGLYNHSYNDLKRIRIKPDRRLARTKVAFGHMSVSDNVMNSNTTVSFSTS